MKIQTKKRNRLSENLKIIPPDSVPTEASRLLGSGLILACLIGFLGGAEPLIVGCSSSSTGSNDEKISDVQVCLDKSTADTARSCLEPISSLSTPQAQLMRCSALFIEQGFSDPTKLVSIVDSLKTSGSSTTSNNDVMTTTMSVLAFKKSGLSQDENYNRAKEAFTYCQASGSKGMSMLASLSKMTTGLLNVTNMVVSNPTPETVKTALCDAKNGGASAEVVGSAALAAYTTSCVTADDKQKLLCSQFQTAINGQTDPEVIGQNLANQITTGSTCP